MLVRIHGAPGYGEMRRVDLANRFAETPDRRSWPMAKTLQALCAALREGFAAHRQYHCLRRRGIHHDAALRHALGVSHRQKGSIAN
jgi:hypothetical protein